MLILSVFKNQLTILTGIVLFKIKIAPNNAESYRKHYIIYFVTSFPQKILKIDYKNPEWINKSIRLSLKKRTKLTKKYHMNPTISNKEALTTILPLYVLLLKMVANHQALVIKPKKD